MADDLYARILLDAAFDDDDETRAHSQAMNDLAAYIKAGTNDMNVTVGCIAAGFVWLKTRYYPVDVGRRLIYDDPHRTACKCSLGGHYRGRHTIGVRGARLNTYDVYQTFTVVPALLASDEAEQEA